MATPTPYNLSLHNSCSDCTVRQNHTFCNMGASTLAAMDTMKFTSVYPKGSILFVEGEEPRGVFVICSGRVKLTTSSSEGRTLIVRVAGPGEVLGASGAILGRPFELSAETIEPSQVNFIGRPDFMRLLNTHPEACMHAAQQLSEKYHSAQREIRSLGLAQTTSEKLARLILDWCEQDGDVTPHGTRLQVLLTHEEIAQMIGTTRETVTRIFSGWRKKQMIEMRGSNLFIRSQQQLSDLVTV